MRRGAKQVGKHPVEPREFHGDDAGNVIWPAAQGSKFNGPLALFGWGGNDFLAGGGNRDHLFGGEGDDRLVGGRGRDFFHVGEGIDTIEDFSRRDKIVLSDEIADAVGDKVDPWEFANPHDPSDAEITPATRLIWKSGLLDSSGAFGLLYFDPDGSGPLEPVQIARIESVGEWNVPLTLRDILIDG